MVGIGPDGNGKFHPKAIENLQEAGAWLKVNGEAIYGSRPWLVFGEGPVRAKGGSFNEKFDFTAKDIRFTTQGRTLYAIALGWPAGNQMVIHSLAQTDDATQNQIKRVELLGHKGKLKFTQSKEGLVVELPAEAKPGLTCALRITGRNLVPAPAQP